MTQQLTSATKRALYEDAKIVENKLEEALEVFCDIAEYCQKNEINYCLGGTTASLYSLTCLGFNRINPIDYQLSAENFFGRGNHRLVGLQQKFCLNVSPCGYLQLLDYLEKSSWDWQRIRQSEEIIVTENVLLRNDGLVPSERIQVDSMEEAITDFIHLSRIVPLLKQFGTERQYSFEEAINLFGLAFGTWEAPNVDWNIPLAHIPCFYEDIYMLVRRCDSVEQSLDESNKAHFGLYRREPPAWCSTEEMKLFMQGIRYLFPRCYATSLFFSRYTL